MKITAEDITSVLQTIKKGVDESDLGPLYVCGDVNAQGNPTKIYSPVAFEAYKIILSAVVGKEHIEMVNSEPSDFDINEN